MECLDRSLRQLHGYRLRRASSAVMSKFNLLFADFGLRRTTFSALSLIVDNPGVRQSQIAEALEIERPNIVQIIAELEAAKLVQRKTAKDDRRAYALQPTAMGRRLYERAMQAATERDAVLVEGLNPEQIDLLHRALATIQHNAKMLEASDGLEIS